MNTQGPESFIRVSAPGRICLLGEHQDYLGLEVISGAMNLRVRITAEPAPENTGFDVHCLQTREHRRILPQTTTTLKNRDYLQSGLNIMLSKGYRYRNGFRIVIDGDLPIGKGVSSSSALCVAWIKLLAAIADEPVDMSPVETARSAFECEVTRFREPGGMQDHIASAMGGLLHMNFRNKPDVFPEITPIQPVPDGFLLIDSGQKKDTLGMIQRIRSAVESQYAGLFRRPPSSLADIRPDDLPPVSTGSDIVKELRGTVLNRNITRKALQLWPDDPVSLPEFLAPLIHKHHRCLTHFIGSSSPAIDACISRCLQLGALAGKVIGSGGGGCLLVYAPGNTVRLSVDLESAGYRVWQIMFDRGVTLTGNLDVLNR